LLFLRTHASLSGAVPGSAQWNSWWPLRTMYTVIALRPCLATSTICIPSRNAVLLSN
jgi:hypothetical protein